MKPEANVHYFSALFFCALLIWLIGPLVLSFVFDAVTHPTVPGKFVSPNQVRSVLNDTFKFIGIMGWSGALLDWNIRGFPWRRRGWLRKDRGA